MLNPNLKLNPKIFNDDPSNPSGQVLEQVPIRKGFGEGLLKAGEADKNVVALCADLTESTQMNFFKEKFPERFIEVGVAEQNLVTISSGMAAMGKIPFCSSYAMFSPGRIGNKSGRPSLIMTEKWSSSARMRVFLSDPTAVLIKRLKILAFKCE